MSQTKLHRGVVAAGLLLLAGSAGSAQQRVQVIVTAVPNPVPAGSCTGILVEVHDTTGQRVANVDGIQLYPNSYDFTVPNVADFAWRNNDPASGYLCTRIEAGPVSTPVIATVRGTAYSGSTLLAIQPAAVNQVATNTPAAGAPAQTGGAAPYAQPGPGGAVVPSQPYVPPPSPGVPPDPAPQPGGYPQPQGQPVQASTPASQGYAQPAAPQSASPSAQTYAQPGAQPVPAGAVPPQGYAPPPTGYQPPPTGYQPPPQPTQNTPAVAYQPVTGAPQPQPQPIAAAPAPEKKGIGGFFKKIGKHIKDRAGEVTNATAQNLASSATHLVDTTLQTGSGLVSGTVAGVSNAAQVTVGTTGKNLLPSALRMDGSSDNLSLALGSGRAVLRAMRFDPANGQLTPASLELAKRVAAELRAKQVKWVIEAYVDPGPGDQELSEYRAGLVKAALIHYGVPGESLTALGYGPSKLDAQVPPEGGPPTAQHIDIAQRAE